MDQTQLTFEGGAEWEKFSIGYRGPRRSHLHVSINKRGKIQLNTFLMELLDYPEAVALYYDRTRSWVGIKPAARPDEDALPVNMRSERRYGEVYALSFLRCFNIRIGKTIATSDIVTARDGMFIVDLRKTSEIHGKPQDAAEKSTPFASEMNPKYEDR